jgi:Protein of unknown function (DUF2889)
MHDAVVAGAPGFRRRFRVTPGVDSVRVELEDDFHCMNVTVIHRDGVATEIESEMERAPWTTCPGAVERLKKTFTAVALDRFAERGEKRENCTHLHDLATLGAAHAFDAKPLAYEVLVSDPVDGGNDAVLRRNGETVLRWSLLNGRLIDPPEIAGLTLDKLGSWIASLEPQLQEQARVLRWGTMIAHGRAIPLEKQSDARRMPAGNCFTFQPEMQIKAQRIGEMRDFSRGAGQPLESRRATS